jgi:2-(1,2-epoxy-1,2-dihydrophenyl)acetyl-CoA isomerase
MEAKDFQDIKYEKDEATGIVMVTLNTPKRKNAMSPYTFLELFWAVEAMEKDAGARVMILTGAKDPDSPDPTREAFSSGGYFNVAAMVKMRRSSKTRSISRTSPRRNSP